MVSLANKSRSFSVDDDDIMGQGDGGDILGEQGNVIRRQEPDDDLHVLIKSDSSQTENKLTFKPVDTLIACALMIIISIGKFIVSVVVPLKCSDTDCLLKPLSVLLYLHALSWGIFLICDQHIQYQHMRVRHRGYLDFYLQLRDLSQLPFRIVSTWSTLLLVVSIVLHDHCRSDDLCGKSIQLTKAEYITICFGAETLVLLIILLYYGYRVRHFNGTKAPPDVLREDMMSSISEIGPKSLGNVEEIFERQADMIRYYKDHNAMLQRKVLELNHQLSGRSLNTS